MKNCLFWIYAICLSCTVYAGPLYTDCERPPTIHHGKAELSVDEDGIIVTALYSCDAGYQLNGQAAINCNTDSDVWEGNLPVCKLETGSNSTVSEIEPPEVIESLATISPEITHQEFHDVRLVDQVTTGQPNENELETNSLENDEIQETAEPDDADDQETSSTTVQKKRRRKGKINEFQEDNTIDEDFASRLDMSCIDGTAAPSVDNAYVVEYIRARKGEYRFLVAVYACTEYYKSEDPQSNRLYCGQGNWIGNYPICVPTGDAELDYGNETDDDNQNGIDDTNKSETNNLNSNSVQSNTEIDQKIQEPTAETIDTVPATINEITDEDAPILVEPTIEHRDNFAESSSCDVNNGGCEQTCTMVPDEEIGANVVECSCQIGFYLDDEGQKCLDFNECEEPSVAQSCPNGCENTIGSYHCVESSDVEIIASNVDVAQTTEINAPVKACGDGLRFDSNNNCEDIDECLEGNTGCEYCQNTVGSYQCTCPDGFELGDDDKTCKDIDECTTFSDYDYEENSPIPRTICSHECVNTIGSYLCRCPINFHLHDDKRTCEQDYCRHLGDVTSNKTKCSHDCVDEVDGYKCKCPEGMDLDADLKTCIYSLNGREVIDACATSEDRCLPGKCINTDNGSFDCECPTGFALHNQRCIDYDECAIGTHECSHRCKNIDGSYLCECPDDLTLASDKHTCVSSDLCAVNNGGCSDICNIVNEQVVCSCPDGDELNADGQTCGPKNICATDNGGCEHICNIELNRCECYPGFETFDDGKNCQDLNECLQNNGGCRQQCVNREGSYECTCFEGYDKDDASGDCIDRNECDSNNGNCDHDCVNTIGSYSCVCRPGFHLSTDQHQCFDINECDSNNGNCSHTCHNLLGSYSCACPPGQFLVNDEHTCDYLNECEVNNGGCSHICNHNKGVRTCACPVGFELDEAGTVCIDQNECLLNNGDCAHQCENLNGTHVCKCNVGYQLASDNHGCVDRDECIDHNGDCSNICINLLGSYSCACEAGFELKDDKHTCQDIDECGDAIHDCDQICVNVPGSYECDCEPGYKLARDHLSCIDIDECSLPNACANGSKCENTIGSFNCIGICPNGFELTESNECIDKNECNDDAANRCSHECLNTVGSFKCACPKGMELASDLSNCVDINECIVNAGICSHFCDNVEGSFQCSCPVGYVLDDNQRVCKDIDECALNNGECEQQCVNIEGSSYCECNVDGFTLADDKRSCINADPCGLKNGGCAHVCEPLNGKAQCFCYKGFELSSSDNRSCSDINECLLNHGCESKCINSIGSYKCDCPKGFRLNAAGSCEDVNECELYDNGGCSPNSECINFLGSFKCICPTGYKLDHDKLTCIEIKDNCQAISAPEHGDVRCSRSRHTSQWFYQTKCSFWCNEGYTLMGPSVKYCNGTDGIWDLSETTCVPSTCPPLPVPQHGTLQSNCLKGKIYPGESCAIICPPGFKNVGAAVAQCLPSRRWSTTNLNCAPLQVTKAHVQQGGIQSRGQTDLNAPAPAPRKHLIKPYIKCPRDTTLLLPKNKKTIYIKLEQPKSNVDWASHVDAFPPWAKQLQAHLGAGVHTITFRARSPNSVSIHDECRTVIVVKSADAPQVHFCPPTINIQLRPNELQRAIDWIEPNFRSQQQLKQIFKSHLPGTKFGAGQHKITYIATDVQNQNATCQFSVIVRPSQAIARVINPYAGQQFGPQYRNPLHNHESYLLCQGKPAMKLDTNFPIRIPNGCYIKNVRLNHIQPYNPHHRRHAFTPNNNFLRYYSSWDRPEYSRYYF